MSPFLQGSERQRGHSPHHLQGEHVHSLCAQSQAKSFPESPRNPPHRQGGERQLLGVILLALVAPPLPVPTVPTLMLWNSHRGCES